MEEGGGDKKNLRLRLDFETRVMDLKRAHHLIGVEHFHSSKPILQRTWRGMCRVMLHLEEIEIIDNSPVIDYQVRKLGRSNGDTLLCELLPIPCRNRNEWGYKEFVFESKEEYEKKIIPKRIEEIRDKVKRYKPRVVVCYGKGKNGEFWQHYGKIFEINDLKPLEEIKAVNFGETIVLFTRHFCMAPNSLFSGIASIIRERCPSLDLKSKDGSKKPDEM